MSAEVQLSYRKELATGNAWLQNYKLLKMLQFYIWDGIRSLKENELNIQYIDGIPWEEFVRLRFFWEECEELGLHINYDDDSFFNKIQTTTLFELCITKHHNANKEFFENGIGKKPCMVLYVHLIDILQKVIDSEKCLYLRCD